MFWASRLPSVGIWLVVVSVVVVSYFVGSKPATWLIMAMPFSGVLLVVFWADVLGGMVEKVAEEMSTSRTTVKITFVFTNIFCSPL